MNEADTSAETTHSTTWSHLLGFGFYEEPKSSWTPKLYYDFGSFVLEASLSVNRYFREMVIFGGSYSRSGEIGMIEFELPPNLVTAEQTAAMIFYYLRDYLVPKPPTWFTEGASNSALLPWEIKWQRERDRKAEIPQCDVSKEWLRLALKEMMSTLEVGVEPKTFGLEFDGSILTIRCGDQKIAMVGIGNAWSNRYELTIDSSKSLPKRLVNATISVDGGHLWIAGRPVAKITEIPLEPLPDGQHS